MQVLLADSEGASTALSETSLGITWRAGIAVAGALLVASAALAEPEQVVTLDVRTGQPFRVLVQRPSRPSGSVVLLAGGHGNLDISPDGRIGWGGGNQVVRSRGLYAAAGFVSAVPDLTPDEKRGDGVEPDYRWSESHARDIGGLIARLRAEAPPVWLVGTSRGSLSVANAAVRLTGPERPDGIVITSGLLMHIRGRAPSVETHVGHLERITLPTLLVQHEWDGCPFTPATAVAPFRALLTAAPRVDVRMLRGGDPRGDPCEARAYHGFNGLDREVVEVITGWFKANTPSR